MAIPGAGICNDCNYELFPDGKGIYHFFQTGRGLNMHFAGFSNYVRMFQDKVFLRSVGNTFFYLIIQVPIPRTILSVREYLIFIVISFSIALTGIGNSFYICIQNRTFEWRLWLFNSGWSFQLGNQRNIADYSQCGCKEAKRW